jgi:hypothetical protein
MGTTDRRDWFADQQTKAEMNTLAIGIIGEIMGDKSTKAWQKVIAIAKTLQGMNQAWDIKDAPLPEGANEKVDQTNCSINLGKVEPLVDKAWAEDVLRNEDKDA